MWRNLPTKQEHKMTSQAQIAINSARNYKKLGRSATLRYVIRHGCPVRLYYLARTLEAAQKVVNLDPVFLQQQAY
jgi:hypothetical protein